MTDKMAVELWQKMAVKKFAYVRKKQYLCSVIKKHNQPILIIKDLRFYRIAIRKKFTFENCLQRYKIILILTNKSTKLWKKAF